MIKTFNDLKIGDAIYDIIDDKFYRNTIIEITPHPLYFGFHLKDQNGYKWEIGVAKNINGPVDYLSSSHLLIADKKIFHDLCRNGFVI